MTDRKSFAPLSHLNSEAEPKKDWNSRTVRFVLKLFSIGNSGLDKYQQAFWTSETKTKNGVFDRQVKELFIRGVTI